MAPHPGHEPADVPGIDSAELLERIGGDQELYWELLRELSGGYRDFPARIAAGITGDVEEATRLAHTLKGVLGNLAAMEMHSIARDLHHAIREGDRARGTELAAKLGSELTALCDAIDSAGGTDVAAADAAPEPPGEHLADDYRRLAESLRGNLARECKRLVKEMAARDLPASEQAAFGEVERLVRAYRFEEALSLVEQRLRG